MRNNIKKFFAGASIAAVSFLPLAALAQESTIQPMPNQQTPKTFRPSRSGENSEKTTVNPNQPRGQAISCEQFLANVDQMGKRLAEAKTRFAKEKTEKLSNLKERFTENKSELIDKNKEASAKVQKLVDRLNAKATTDSQKQAVSDFQASFKAAHAARQAAVQAALDAFKSAAQGLQSQTNNGVNDAVTKFNAAVAAAVAQAKTDCSGSTPDLGKAKRKFVSSIEQAKHELLTSAKGGKTNISDDLEKLIKTRNDAIKKAQQDFRAAMKTAMDKLKAAFANPSSTAPKAPEPED